MRPKVPFCFNQGYNRMPEKTVESWYNLWHHTGGGGCFAAEGRLCFPTQVKDQFCRGGENIASFEIEQVLDDRPYIVESGVVGIRVEGARDEDDVKACIVSVAGRKQIILPYWTIAPNLSSVLPCPDILRFLKTCQNPPPAKFKKNPCAKPV